MYDIDQLEAYRQVSDETGDQLIQNLYKDLTPKEIGQLFQKYINDLEEVNYNEMPKALRNYFLENQELPEWADINQVKIAEELFLKVGPEYSLALLARGLAVGYVSANTVKVLTSTGYLSSDVKVGTAKRLLETSQFIFDVLSRDALRPNNRGVKSVLKVRFIHSMIRYHLNKHGWDHNRYGLPVNQEDMSGTILTFSVSAIQGMEQMNIQLSKNEKDAIVHFWSLVGHVIGVVPELNPCNYEQGKLLYETILDRQAVISEDGRKLTKALAIFIKAVVDLPMFPNFQYQLMRFLIANEKYSEILGLEKTKNPLEQMTFKLGVSYLKTLNQFRDNPIANYAAKPLNRLLAVKLMTYFDTEFDMHLSIPEEIKKRWGILDENELPSLKRYPFIRSIVAQGKNSLAFG